MAGNMTAWCLNAPEKQYRNNRCPRGGFWGGTVAQAKSGYRIAEFPDHACRPHGLRAVLRPQGQKPPQLPAEMLH